MTPPKTQPYSSYEADRLRLFISAVTDYAIYMLSTEGTIVSWNAGAQRFKGYTADEVIGRHFSIFYTDEDRKLGIPVVALEQASTTGKFEAEGWRVRKDGTRFWASVVIDPIRDESGTLVGYAKITRDITEKKLDQEALRESEERFRMLVQGVTDYAIYMLSPNGTITNWNAGARRIKQYEHDEVVGSHFSRFYAEEDRRSGLPQRALETAATQGRFESEGWRVRKDGTRFWAHVVIDAIRNDMGRLVGFAKITRDITERRHAAEQLDKAREALSRSQKLEAIGKLTGGVAHDFNNLLNVVGNSLTLLRRSDHNPADLRLMDAMEQAVKRGATLTQQLLTFARQQPMMQEQRDLSRVIASFEAVLRRAGRGGLALDIDLAADLPPVKIDVAQFETALLNVAVNAQDATAEGGRIVVSTSTRYVRTGEAGSLAEGQYVVVSVRDTGTGMAPEVAARAVEPFFTTKEVGRGTGLGLSQAYGMVQQSGGDLLIASRPGEGTIVSMYFPAMAADRIAVEPVDCAHERVLLVDDEPDLLETTGELFRSLGFDVLSANSGEEALELVKRTPDLQLLFSDVVMPGMSGVELARKARALSPGLNVILASGYVAENVLGQDDAAVRNFGFLAKPYRLSDLVQMLRKMDRASAVPPAAR